EIGGGRVIEAGGQWMGELQDRLMALARELGIGYYHTFNTGDNVYYRQGQRSLYDPHGPLGAVPLDPTGDADVLAQIQQLNSMSAEVPIEKPWTARSAQERDGQT